MAAERPSAQLLRAHVSRSDNRERCVDDSTVGAHERRRRSLRDREPFADDRHDVLAVVAVHRGREVGDA